MRRLSLVSLVWLVAASAPAQSVITGTIRNGTTGQPGRADIVNLMRAERELETVATVKDVEGEYRFDEGEREELGGVLADESFSAAPDPEGPDAGLEAALKHLGGPA